MNLTRRGFFGGLAAATTSYFFFGSGLWVPSKKVVAVPLDEFAKRKIFAYGGEVGTGNREDLLDIITNIYPMKTLRLSGFEKVPRSLFDSHEWLVDTLK